MGGILGVIVAVGILVAAPAAGAGDHERIVYTRPDGGVSVIAPDPQCLQQLMRPWGTPQSPGECPALGLTRRQAVEWVRDKDVPVGATGGAIIDRGSLPVSRRFRAAWRQDLSGAPFVNLAAARPIVLGEVRAEQARRMGLAEVAHRAATLDADPPQAIAAGTCLIALHKYHVGASGQIAALASVHALGAWTPTWPRCP